MRKEYYLCDVCGKKLTAAKIHGRVEVDVVRAKRVASYDLCEECVDKVLSIFKEQEDCDGA